MNDFLDEPTPDLAARAWVLGNGYGLGAAWGVSPLGEALHEAAQRLHPAGDFGPPTAYQYDSDAELITTLLAQAEAIRQLGRSLPDADLIEAVAMRLGRRN